MTEEQFAEERFAELVTENAELRKRRDELLRENNRLVEERRALVVLSHSECHDLAKVAYDAWRRAKGASRAMSEWEMVGGTQQADGLSEACAVVVTVRAKISAQERQAIIDLLGGGDDE
jgi:hypothetical protein